MEPIEVIVNGQVRDGGRAGPHTSLLDWLRGEGLTSVKEGCAEGECGACAVLVARPDGPDGARWTALNACLPPALAFDGQEIVTAEGLGTAPGACAVENLHPVQREMAGRGGSQCGYCTPGFVCAMAAEYYRPGRGPRDAARAGEVPARPGSDTAAAGTSATSGSATGTSATSTSATSGSTTGTSATSGSATGTLATSGSATGTSVTGTEHAADHEVGPNGFDLHALSGNLCRCTGYRPIRDAAYALGAPDPQDPLAGRLGAPAPAPRHTRLSTDVGIFVRPGSLEELFDELDQHPDAILVAGATDAGVDRNIRHTRPQVVLAVDRLAPLRTHSVSERSIELGAALTLSEIESVLGGRVPLLGALFPQFASRLIRNAATLGGNLGTASPIGDAAPVLLALDATLVLASRGGEREVPLADYFTGYRTSVRAPGEIIRAVRVPLPLAGATAFYKIAKRRFDDISSVAVAVAARVGSGAVEDVRIGLGGVAATPVRARATEDALRGRPWTYETAVDAAAVMAEEGTPLDDHRASARYRRAMLEQSLLRFFAQNQPAETLEAAR